MSQDLPSAPELLDAVREFLEGDLLDRLDARTKFHARVAANVVGIVARELRLGPDSDAAERERLLALFGETAEDLDTLNRRLASGIRDGTLAARDAEVMAHVRQTTADKLRIANPSYPTA